MTRNIKRIRSAHFLLALAGGALACNSLVGLDDLRVSEGVTSGAGTGGTRDGGVGSDGGSEGALGGGGGAGAEDGEAGGGGEPGQVGECITNQDCIDQLSAERSELAAGGAGGDGVVAAVCIYPEQRCEPLLSEDCDVVTGDYTDDRAILLGSLFSTKGPQSATNIPRQQAAALAIEQINAVGGVPDAAGEPRPLVLVSCDETTNLVRAAQHLVEDLKVPAIVGPNTSQDTLDVSNKVTVPAGTVVITPTAVASSITALNDNGLTWLMVPSDVQRAPLMLSQITELEEQLKVARNKATIKLGIVYRDDALGVGTRTSLNALEINGKGLTHSINLGNNVEIDGYIGTLADQQPLVDKYLSFEPDIVVLAGTAEAVSKFMVPLENQWTGGDRPSYVLIDSTKVPELITAVTNNEDLRVRVRGTGITSGPPGKGTPAEAYDDFKIAYNARYDGTSTISGMGPSHDAAYAIGLALAATTDLPVSGESIALGLRRLAGGSARLTTLGTNLLPAFQELSSGRSITAIGSFGALEWDEDGAVKGGTLEMWCIGGTPDKPAYESSGLTFDIMTQTENGTYEQCGE